VEPRRLGQGLSQLIPLAASHMLLSAPQFRDKTGYFSFENWEYVFRQLHVGLGAVRQTLGEDRYHELMGMSDRMRTLFEVDPEDKTGETAMGCKIIFEMEDILKQVRRKS
jgi:hypothetical protein